MIKHILAGKTALARRLPSLNSLWFKKYCFPTYMVSVSLFLIKVTGKGYPQVKEELPQNRKDDALQTIGNDARLEPTAKQAENTILQNNNSSSLGYIL